LLANELAAADEQAMEDHVVECDACRRRLDELTSFAGAMKSRVSVRRDDNAEPMSPGGVLARLANSSKPALRVVKANTPAKKRLTESFLRRLGRSATITDSGRFLRRQAWTWPLIAAAVFAVGAWLVGGSVEEAMRKQRANMLHTVLNADIAALRQWIDNERAAAELVAADERLRPTVQELSALTGDSAGARARLIRAPAQDTIRSFLTGPQRRREFVGFILVSPTGTILAADDDAPLGAELSEYRRDFFTSLTGNRGAVSKPFASPLMLPDKKGTRRANLPCMYAAAPIHDDDGTRIAVLGLRLRPDDEFTQILQVARSGNSGETYAFDRNGLLLSQSRFDDELRQMGLLVDQPGSASILTVELRDPVVNMKVGERPTLRRADQPLTWMAASAVKGHDDYNADGYNDYRGVPVVGAWQWLEEYDFGVATEIDVEEAFAPVYVLRGAFAVLVGLLIAAAAGIFLAMQFIARQRRELHNATAAATQLGQYTLVEKLGTGGMGTVYKAKHALLRRLTAVKLLNPESITDTAIARFEREVQLTSGLTHANTVAIYDFGRTSTGVFYYAMEYLEGVNLDEFVRRYGPLPEARAVYVLRQICASLAEAHATGLVHRDVKPANIFLTLRGGQHDFVKVLDFGLAKWASDSHEANLTSTNTVAGTPLYVSPEAITHPAQIDARADVYGIGAVGYFLLTGSPVFSGSSATDICLKHVRSAPEPPSARIGHPVSPDLESLLLRCLAKAPEDRPVNSSELLRLLEACHVAGSWTAADAARWWADRDREQSATSPASKTSDAPEPPEPPEKRTSYAEAVRETPARNLQEQVPAT
jgi:serine/threonine protein kinase